MVIFTTKNVLPSAMFDLVRSISREVARDFAWGGSLFILIGMLGSALFLPYRIILYMCRLAFILVFNGVCCIISNVKYHLGKLGRINHVTSQDLM
jgi:hypothetical protein